jgi:small basic protein (TIGR04137 family)
MSLHKSLKTRSSLVRSRNVLKRSERLEILLKEGRRTEEDSAYGLPKVRVYVMAKVKKKKKKKEDEKEGASAEAVAPDAAKAAGKKA